MTVDPLEERIRAEAAFLGYLNPSAAAKLADRSMLVLDEDGSPRNLREVLERVAEESPWQTDPQVKLEEYERKQRAEAAERRKPAKLASFERMRRRVESVERVDRMRRAASRRAGI